VQFNVCVDAFRKDTAATQFVRGSHSFKTGIPHDWNVSPHLRIDVDSRVEHMLAPAGGGIIYDARTWHRACPECNHNDEDRIAILNYVTPRTVRLFADKKSEADRFKKSAIKSMLTQRERDVVERLCSQN
jgi:ectoine hydroxylase-related dioxygenase (phytanoyl-CoA dioxygenase family)